MEYKAEALQGHNSLFTREYINSPYTVHIHIIEGFIKLAKGT